MGVEDQSLQKIYANFFAQRISKSQQLTNWEADVLTEAQKRYAATDAWACIQIYKDILQLEENGYMLELIPLPEQPPIAPKTQSQKEDKKARKKKKEQDRYRRSRSKEKISRRLDKERKDKEKLKAIK
jgi:ribonuclease D